jgi:hypothetical protein
MHRNTINDSKHNSGSIRTRIRKKVVGTLPKQLLLIEDTEVEYRTAKICIPKPDKT